MTTLDRFTGHAQVTALVENFRRFESSYLAPSYNETQARTDFITPLLEAFGWDVHNVAGLPLALREVIEEANVAVGNEPLSKKPDYELRLARQRKFFVEAKKPNIPIAAAKAAAFQTRRYGYSASLPISVLTNFHQLAIYDCLHVPRDTDEAHVARLLLLSYDEFESHFDQLWELLSRETVYSGAFDARFAIDVTHHGTSQFDNYFLAQVRRWRQLLAIDIHANATALGPNELTYAVQLFLTRIVFLRVCEDRDLEKYATLKDLDTARTFPALMRLLQRADAFYDSGLFRLLDDAPLGIRISDATLQTIISELYYPESPYTFAVVEAEVLGEIYEQFLGDVITINGDHIEIVTKPEVKESGGVFSTPRYVVDAIVQRTLAPCLAGKSPADLDGFTVADICCGSGIFLLSAYEMLLGYHLSWYLEHDRAQHVGRTIYDTGAGVWRLMFDEKRRILEAHIRGVDIDSNAVEVARFSLLLKLIEDESAEALQEYVRTRKSPALPELDDALRSGNSLVSRQEWAAVQGRMPPSLADKVNPFDWPREFPDEVARGGFDVIVGNPPYIRIQNMAAYSPDEVAYYQMPGSPFLTAHQDNFDKYALFIERSLSLLGPAGRLGVIVPHKFTTIKSGRALRSLIAQGRYMEQLVHFGVKPVFGTGTSNYTCILILDRRGCPELRFEQATALERWRYDPTGPITLIPAADLTEDGWQFANPEARALFERILHAHPARLDTMAEILVGLQTSADAVYMVHPVSNDSGTVTMRWGGRDWRLERAVLRHSLHDAPPLGAYTRPQPNAWILFPYEIVPQGQGRRARLIQPAEFASRYPGCWAYLSARREELAGRSVTGGPATERQWYQYGRSQSLTKFDTPKIILPVLSTEPRYTYDTDNVMITGGGNGPYLMVRSRTAAVVSDLYLLAVLNHPLSEAFVRSNTSPFRGGYYSHGKQFINDLPIPVPDGATRATIETLVQSLMDANDAAAAARLPHERQVRERDAAELRSEIEARVSAVFGLSSDDMDIVGAVPIPE